MKLLSAKINQDQRRVSRIYASICRAACIFHRNESRRNISALTWNDITEDGIIIDKSEKYNRKTKEYYIDSTKNGKERIFPMTMQIKNCLIL